MLTVNPVKFEGEHEWISLRRVAFFVSRHHTIYIEYHHSHSEIDHIHKKIFSTKMKKKKMNSKIGRIFHIAAEARHSGQIKYSNKLWASPHIHLPTMHNCKVNKNITAPGNSKFIFDGVCFFYYNGLASWEIRRKTKFILYMAGGWKHHGRAWLCSQSAQHKRAMDVPCCGVWKK